jgi:hypothetical protein
MVIELLALAAYADPCQSKFVGPPALAFRALSYLDDSKDMEMAK